MPKMPVLRAKDFLAWLLKYGCEEIRVRGSHHQIFNPDTGRISTVAIHGGLDVKRGDIAGTLRQLGIDVDEFLAFIKNN
ncbi:MAG: type II toxin-antitoxin system HicA family toxin [Oscillospiraceae bacterium]|nr:type II toxin-antitoxin system HicA family toxin [Oscillospiraceae bacterium]